MMPEIGNGLLCLALGIALLLSVYPLWGVARGDARMMASSRLLWVLLMSGWTFAVAIFSQRIPLDIVAGYCGPRTGDNGDGQRRLFAVHSLYL